MGAFRKEVLRSITHSWGRFLAIAVMAALGCGFYAGLRMTGPDMRLAGDEYYDATELCDLRVVSSLGMSPTRRMPYLSWQACSTRCATIRLTLMLRKRAVATMACMCDRTMTTT